MLKFYIKEYHGPEGYFIFSKSKATTSRAQKEGCMVIFWSGEDYIQILPSQSKIKIDEKNKFILNSLNEWDVIAINNNHIATVCYSGNSSDNAIVITLACNSNCIMCPLSAQERYKSAISTLSELMDYARCIPSDTEFLTITGGEPFLLGNDIFKLFSFLKKKFTNTHFLLLTNGRVFSNNFYTAQFVNTHPAHIVTGIPIHGSTSEIHDKITHAPGSFQQTILGIKHLLSYDEHIEIRFVISRLNEFDITNMAQLIVNEIPNIDSVKFMGLEMLGNAAIHASQVWLDYKKAFLCSKKAINILLAHGIDVELYNFPLCCVDKSYWGLYRRSISKSKIRYLNECDDCSEKSICGGFFSGTVRLVNKVFPISNN